MSEVSTPKRRRIRAHAQSKPKDYTGIAVLLFILNIFLPILGLVAAAYHLWKAYSLELSTGQSQKGVWILWLAFGFGTVVTLVALRGILSVMPLQSPF